MNDKKLKEIRDAIKDLPSGEWEWEKKKGQSTKLISKAGGTTHILLWGGIPGHMMPLLVNCRDYIEALLEEVKRLKKREKK